MVTHKMVISELHKTLEKRKIELISLMKNNESNLDIEKQHQIFGAINELEIVLETLDYYRNQEIINCDKENNGNDLQRIENKDRIEDNSTLTNSPPQPASRSGSFGFLFGLKDRLFKNRRK
ncbi:MAG: hypothetical protein KKF44_09630 [Nanoarchaeota archaeon]|nr:hypothetical protein [Nanoarchaeota archaeon]